ncbi:hypothetical protein IKQ21_04380 [bacterium]|nr:hypothetical protein [bacterium]
MTAISNNNSSKSSFKNGAIGTAAFIAGWESQTYLSKFARIPVLKYSKPQFEYIRGGGFLPYVNNALEQNGLMDKVEIVNVNKNNAKQIWKDLNFRTEEKTTIRKIIDHLLRLPSAENSFVRTVNGSNAFYLPRRNAIVCNFEKFGAPIFHEIQHKINRTSSNIFLKSLAKVKHPLAIFGPLSISCCALIRDKKKDGEKENILDKIKNNCGLLAFLCVLPHTIEEFIANIKGTSIAKKAGVSGELLKKIKVTHKVSMIGYGASALITALSVWGGNKIRDLICKLKDK